MKWIDLRSDTVTEPTEAMRRAMAEAEVGDDVYGDDPTVNRLEAMAAERMGKQAAVFVPSGTMGNLAAIMSHCRRGDEMLLGDQSHSFLYEAGGAAALAGVQPRAVANQPDGTLGLDDLERAVRGDDEHFPISRLIVLENTQNAFVGAVLTPEYTQQVADLADRHGLQLHLDGARIFNAAAALGVEATELAAPADSVTFCLSKGLCAPVGSVLCGSKDFIRNARRARKQLGGGMRQAGVLAAAGIVALEQMTERLIEDHQRAQRLSAGLAALPHIQIQRDPPPSNMVYLTIDPASGFSTRTVIDHFRRQGVKLAARDAQRMRLVVHYWIDDDALEQIVSGFRDLLDGA